MLPEEKARIKINEQLTSAGWEVVTRFEYNRKNPSAVVEASMLGQKESDYLLFVDNKAIAVVEAKRAENNLDDIVAKQAEDYTLSPQSWYGFWLDENKVPLVYLANGETILFKNMLVPDSKYESLTAMHTPKEMLRMIGKNSDLGALPIIEKKGLRDCQYRAEVNLEASFKEGKKRALAVLATGSGKTYLACLATYRFLEYTPTTKRVLFLADRNNLANQAKTEFSLFDRIETGHSLKDLYEITRLKKEEDIKGDIVISTIQKLYAVLTGQTLPDCDEDSEDELEQEDREKHSKEVVTLNGDLKLPSDYFQLIIVDECHRSIYGRWKAVLDYFNKARILGLTATPTAEAYAFFDDNIVENYSYEDSVVDGVNVPKRIYRIATKRSIHGGEIHKGDEMVEKSKRTNNTTALKATENVDYSPNALDRSIINVSQIETVLREYRDSIYTNLYPERVSENEEENWMYIPKTLIFAKDDNHADQIVEIAKKVFGEKFTDGQVPENYVRKITYSAGDSNVLIRDFRIEKDFRIAVTVTLVATGTDIRPLEVVLFMRDVNSEVLYTQMKGRACRCINDDKLREVTPNAQTKACYYIVDAVGVTEHEKDIPQRDPSSPSPKKPLSLEHLLERLAHGEVSNENLDLLRDYCATIHRRYENNILYGHHLSRFIDEFGFSPRSMAHNIEETRKKGLPEFIDSSHANTERMLLVEDLVDNVAAKKYLLEMQSGYITIIDDPDEVIYSDFSKETALDFTEAFEKYLNENKDRIEALRIIYNSEDKTITHSMLVDLRDKLLSENHSYTSYNIWRNYKLLDDKGSVDEFDIKQNIRALTHLIQIVRFAYRKTARLTSLFSGYVQRFNLYCGQAQRQLTDEQKTVMREIADFVVSEGAITAVELNEYYPDLWRKGIATFGGKALNQEMQTLSNFILKAA